MKTSELMKFPKIRARLAEYWENDVVSGYFGTDDMTQDIAHGVCFSDTDEGSEFWRDLHELEFEDCIASHAEWFKDVELSYDPKDVAFTNSKEDGTVSYQSLLVKFLVNQVNNAQGHGTFSTKYRPNMDELVYLTKQLDIHYSMKDYDHSVFCEIESDGSGSINVRNYYSDNENNKDLLLMTFGDK